MKHHYIPRFYLEFFHDPESKGIGTRTPYLWVYKKGNSKPKGRGAKNVAKITSYYSYVDKAGAEHHDVEEFCSSIESSASSILRRILNKQPKINLEEKAYVSRFLGLLFARIPLSRNRQKKTFENIIKDYIIHRALNPSFCSELEDAKKHVPAMAAMSKTEIENMRQFLSDETRYNIEAGLQSSLTSIISAPKEIGFYFLKRGWKIAVSKEGAKFVSSDCPLMTVRKHLPDIPFYGGLAHKDAIITFPVSPSVCIIMEANGIEGIDYVSTQEVRRINKRTIAYANHIFSSKIITQAERRQIGVRIENGLLNWGDPRITDLWKMAFDLSE